MGLFSRKSEPRDLGTYCLTSYSTGCQASKLLKLAREVVRCYEAELTGFWPHRQLSALGVRNFVVYPTRLDEGIAAWPTTAQTRWSWRPAWIVDKKLLFHTVAGLLTLRSREEFRPSPGARNAGRSAM